MNFQLKAENDKKDVFYQNEKKSVNEGKQAEYEETLKTKEAEINRLMQTVGDLEKDKANLEKDSEDLRTFKISYDKMISAKDKEIKEVEERLEEMQTKVTTL